jgi:asparagine synthase (glutamine-hydrolysing)
MCGIFGVVDKNGIDINKYDSIRQIQNHRGPDNFGTYLSPGRNVHLAHNRLSIIDISDVANQPICNESGEVWLVFNGEIYNFVSLRKDMVSKGHILKSHTDSEVIVHLYEEYGLDFVKYLNGMFALAIYDSRSDKVVLARDHFGQKPLYYHVDNQTIIFASEIKSLVPFVPEKEIDLNALDFYLSYGYSPVTKSIYKGIHKLRPGEICTISKSLDIQKSKYWSPDFSENIYNDESSVIKTVDSLLSRAVERCMVSDVPLGAFLSGGIDSSLVVAKMAQISTSRIKTFTIGFDEDDYSEASYAREIAKYYNTEHHEFILKPDILELLDTLVNVYDEPYADSSAIPTYYLARETRKHVTVALSGDGGDELFGGYERYLGYLYANKYAKTVPRFLRSMINPLLVRFDGSVRNKAFMRRLFWLNNTSLTDSDRAYFHSFFFNKKGERLIDAEIEHDNNEHFQFMLEAYNKNDFGVLEKMLYTDMNSYLPEDIFTKVDRATMAHSLESRAPLLDMEIVDYVQKVVPGLKIKGKTTKYILRELSKKYMPKSLANRKKQGFSLPLGHWFRNEAKGQLLHLRNEGTVVRDGLINKRALQVLIDDHINCHSDNSYILYNLLFLENWYSKVFKK